MKKNRTTIVNEWTDARAKYEQTAADRMELLQQVIYLVLRIPEDSPLLDMLNPYIRDGLYFSSRYTSNERTNMEGVKQLRELLRETFGEWSDKLIEVTAASKTTLDVIYEGKVDGVGIRFEVAFDEGAARECGILSEHCAIKETETTIKGTSVVCEASND